jgi:hypothetical protein
MFFLPSFDLCILFAPPPELTFFIPSFDLCLLFAPPLELMLFLFSIVVVVLAINDKHTLPVKYANTNRGVWGRALKKMGYFWPALYFLTHCNLILVKELGF